MKKLQNKRARRRKRKRRLKKLKKMPRNNRSLKAQMQFRPPSLYNNSQSISTFNLMQISLRRSDEEEG